MAEYSVRQRFSGRTETEADTIEQLAANLVDLGWDMDCFIEPGEFTVNKGESEVSNEEYGAFYTAFSRELEQSGTNPNVIVDRLAPNPFAAHAPKMKQTVTMVTELTGASGAALLVFNDQTYHLESYGDGCQTAHSLVSAGDAIFERIAAEGICAKCKHNPECAALDYDRPEFDVGDVVVTENDPDTEMTVVRLLGGSNRLWVEVEWEETPGYMREEVFAQSLLRKVRAVN